MKISSDKHLPILFDLFLMKYYDCQGDNSKIEDFNIQARLKKTSSSHEEIIESHSNWNNDPLAYTNMPQADNVMLCKYEVILFLFKAMRQTDKLRNISICLNQFTWDTILEWMHFALRKLVKMHFLDKKTAKSYMKLYKIIFLRGLNVILIFQIGCIDFVLSVNFSSFKL